MLPDRLYGRAEPSRSLLGIPLVPLPPTPQWRDPVVATDSCATLTAAEGRHAPQFIKGLLLAVALSMTLWSSLAWLVSSLLSK